MTSWLIQIALMSLLAHIVECEKSRCDEISQKFCCREANLDKCLTACLNTALRVCPRKLKRFDIIRKPDPDEEMLKQRASGDFASSRTIAKSPATKTKPTTLLPLLLSPAQKTRPTPAPKDGDVFGRKRAGAEKAQAAHNLHSVPPLALSSQFAAQMPPPERPPDDYRLLNHNYPITIISDSVLSMECGSENSNPRYSPCLPRETADELFLDCCKQHVVPSCHSLCTYEHRDPIASQLFLRVVQQEHCDLHYLSEILYCANQNRDNRKCCDDLGMSHPQLRVGTRCVRMCNIAVSGDSLGPVTQEDLVCLANWHVIMYCARAGLRTLN